MKEFSKFCIYNILGQSIIPFLQFYFVIECIVNYRTLCVCSWFQELIPSRTVNRKRISKIRRLEESIYKNLIKVEFVAYVLIWTKVNLQFRLAFVRVKNCQIEIQNDRLSDYLTEGGDRSFGVAALQVRNAERGLENVDECWMECYELQIFRFGYDLGLFYRLIFIFSEMFRMRYPKHFASVDIKSERVGIENRYCNNFV